jgi:hypothetical protein
MYTKRNRNAGCHFMKITPETRTHTLDAREMGPVRYDARFKLKPLAHMLLATSQLLTNGQI